jgi:hypothetical protein
MAKAVFCIATTEPQATMIVDQLKGASFSKNDAQDNIARDMAKAIFEHAGAEDISYTEEAGVEKEARA